jgi:hypothetical protein
MWEFGRIPCSSTHGGLYTTGGVEKHEPPCNAGRGALGQATTRLWSGLTTHSWTGENEGSALDRFGVVPCDNCGSCTAETC